MIRNRDNTLDPTIHLVCVYNYDNVALWQHVRIHVIYNLMMHIFIVLPTGPLSIIIEMCVHACMCVSAHKYIHTYVNTMPRNMNIIYNYC